MTDTEALYTFLGFLFIIALPVICIAVRTIYVGNWRHLDIDKEWNASKSRGRIKNGQ